jgi:uncharacterized membrane protein YbhN (UPF0104 family)
MPDRADGEESTEPAAGNDQPPDLAVSGKGPGPLTWGLLAIVAVFVIFAVANNWEAVQSDLALLTWGDIAASSAAGAAAAACSALAWRALLHGLGASLPLTGALAIFFVGQLGKYVPGSVWTAAVQAQLGRERGVRGTTMIISYVLALMISVGTGALIGLLVLLGSAGSDQWPIIGIGLLVAAAVAVPLARPELVNRLLRWAARKAGRSVPPVTLPGRTLALAAVASLGAWGFFGLHVWLLARPLGAGVADIPVATGAFALAFVAGLLVVPLPAGAGVREGVLIATLTPLIGSQAALTVSLVSRFVLLLVDLVLGLASAPGALRRRIG